MRYRRHSKFVHFLGHRPHLNLLTLVLLALLLLFYRLWAGLWHVLSFYQAVEFFVELVYAARQEENVVISFFRHEVGGLSSLSLVGVVHHNQLIRFVLESKQLRYHLVPRDICGREIDTLTNPPVLVILWVSQVQKQKASLVCDAQPIGGVSHRRHCCYVGLLRHLRNLRFCVWVRNIILTGGKQSRQRFFFLASHLRPHSLRVIVTHTHGRHIVIQVINALLISDFLHQFSEGGALDSLVLFALPLCYEVVAFKRKKYFESLFKSITYLWCLHPSE